MPSAKEMGSRNQGWNRGGTFMLNRRGEWVPAIPLPFYGMRKKCSCGAKFWTMDGYLGHYAVKHILDPDE